MATPIGGIGTGAEVMLKRKVPAYSRLTDKMGNKYSKSIKFRKAVVDSTNGLVGGLRNIAV